MLAEEYYQAENRVGKLLSRSFEVPIEVATLGVEGSNLKALRN